MPVVSFQTQVFLIENQTVVSYLSKHGDTIAAADDNDPPSAVSDGTGTDPDQGPAHQGPAQCGDRPRVAAT